MLVVYPGERYDVLIQGSVSAMRKHYYIIFETMEHYARDWSVCEPERGLAVLEYEGENLEDQEIPGDLRTI